MVLSIIQSSLDAPILEAYSHCETAKDLWETLQKVYGNTTNLSRIFEIKKALNNLKQNGLEFTQHLGKYRSLSAELEMLRPSTTDPSILNERREQDTTFGLFITLDPIFNDLIKHILRSEKLPTFDEVCSQVQREQGSIGFFGDKGELLTANKGYYKHEERKPLVCDHCKRRGHNKDKCWILHPHLRPSSGSTHHSPATRFKDPRANHSESTEGQGHAGVKIGERTALTASTSSPNDVLRRSDLEALIKSIASLKDSGISYFTHKPSNALIVDSGASHHMINNPKLLDNIKPALGSVVIANGDKVPVKGIGDLRLFDKESKALYMPDFTSNLLSVKKTTTDLNCYAIFGPNGVHFQDIESMRLLGKGVTKDELYVLEDRSSNHAAVVTSSSCFSVSFDAMWHARLGHPHSRALKLMLPRISFDHTSCESCILGKHCKSVFPKSTTIYDNCFDLVHSDVWTSPCLSRDNNKYFVTFIDEKSKYTWVTLLPSKDRVFDAFINFQTYVTNQYQAKIKVLRTDNGGEYISHRFKEHLVKHGIMHQTSCPYTPQQNGVAERKNRHLMEVARSMMFHTHVPKRFWGDAVLTSCYLINRIPTKVLSDISPYEVLNKTKPSIDHLRVFGCVCFVLVPGEQRSKLDAKSTRCMLIGYSPTQKGYKCYNPTNNRTLVSRDVKFLEEQGYHNEQNWDSLKDLTQSSDRATSLRFLLDHLGIQPSLNRPEGPETNGSPNITDEPTEPTEPVYHNQEGLGHMETTPEDGEEAVPELPTEQGEGDNEPVPVLRRSTRIRQDPSNWINTRVYYNSQAVAHPIQATCSLALVPPDHQAFLGKIESHEIPLTYDEAKEKEVWRDAVEAEVDAMGHNHTWDESDLPQGKRAVSSK